VTAGIFVLAGVNGAGKSSVGGAALRRGGVNYFNPDEAAVKIRRALGCSQEEANQHAWEEGKRLLETAIEEGASHAFESTLGGTSIPRLLVAAAKKGLEIRVWFVGLSNPELHIARVWARVAAGGHDIPEAKIRERWDASRLNIIALMPYLAELRLFDNSTERDPEGKIPPPKVLLHWKDGRVIAPEPSILEATPEWAKPIVACALRLQRKG
jgi:predicted ABC-type ATPase